MRWPDAEVPIDEDLVRRLLHDQHPDLAGLPLHLCDAGWDNVMWRLGDSLAVRLPRRQVAADLVVKEQRWLPELAPDLPLPVPVPLRKGRPDVAYPWYWSVVPWLDGSPGDRTPITEVGASATRLGAFLRAMHRPAPADAPYNPYRSGTVGSRADTFEQRLAKLAGYVDVDRTRAVWDAAVASRLHASEPLWVHGDLHPANTLVDRGLLAAVIDFGDLCAGDPAVDIGAAWMSLPDAGMPAFWDAYGTPDADLVRRSMGWAVLFGLMLLEIGLEGRPTYADVGRATLARMVRSA
ncbi:MAG TPA: aminoglycoside phosphotransferase family protein [Acidimicrobiales bacterium]|nr:aminoglycoside phosphotransferase family protein [Acidimicrobiales bacterium]